MPDFNKTVFATTPVNIAINELLEAAAARKIEAPRNYLGASIIGHDCLRKVQFDWLCDPAHAAQTKSIFARGHYFEEESRQLLKDAGFRFCAKPERLGFKAIDGMFRGHADGIFEYGPKIPGVGFPCLWEHKALSQKGAAEIERNGLDKVYLAYAAQVQIYMAYLDLTDHPCIFTVLNSNTCERLHLLVPFNASRAQAWSDRAVTIIRATMAGELLPRMTENPKDWRCGMCSHRDRCWR